MSDERKTEFKDFNCSKMGALVQIKREFSIHPSGTKTLTGIGCAHSVRCGIGGGSSRNGRNLGASLGRYENPDFAKCVHPELKKRRTE